jgi:hypothetical protein
MVGLLVARSTSFESRSMTGLGGFAGAVRKYLSAASKAATPCSINVGISRATCALGSVEINTRIARDALILAFFAYLALVTGGGQPIDR